MECLEYHSCFFGKSYSEVTQGQYMAVNTPLHPFYTIGVKEYYLNEPSQNATLNPKQNACDII